MRALAGVARGLRLGDYVRLGRGEDGTGGRDKSSILADTLEAVIGAVYIERGLDEASELVHRLFDPVIAKSARLGAGLDWKTSLQELTASGVLGVPEYHVEESGPDHPEVLPCHGPGRRPRVRHRGGALQEGSRAAGRRGRLERHQRRRAAAAGAGTPAHGPPTAAAAPAGAGEAGPPAARHDSREAEADGSSGASGPTG